MLHQGINLVMRVEALKPTNPTYTSKHHVNSPPKGTTISNLITKAAKSFCLTQTVDITDITLVQRTSYKPVRNVRVRL